MLRAHNSNANVNICVISFVYLKLVVLFFFFFAARFVPLYILIGKYLQKRNQFKNLGICVAGKGLIKRQNSGLPRMESLARIGSIPLVESGVKTAEHVYVELKVIDRFLIIENHFKPYFSFYRNATVC